MGNFTFGTIHMQTTILNTSPRFTWFMGCTHLAHTWFYMYVRTSTGHQQCHAFPLDWGETTPFVHRKGTADSAEDRHPRTTVLVF